MTNNNGFLNIGTSVLTDDKGKTATTSQMKISSNRVFLEMPQGSCSEDVFNIINV